jgi:peptidylamidoglycolate lyase
MVIQRLVAVFVLSICAGPLLSSSEYSVVHGWPTLPAGRILGQATGVGVDSHNHVFVFHRAGREWSDVAPVEPIATATVTVFDGTTGKQIVEWGQGLFLMPHGLTIDKHDNVWLTDVQLHQVFKFTHDGDLLLALGTARVPGDDVSHFNLPTDVAVLPDGGFYVSDGYENTRVMKFLSTGVLEYEWGTKGSGPGEFDLPHGIAVDGEGRVYVADRSNLRIQVFSAKGDFIAEWKSTSLGRPYGVAIGPDGKAYVVDGGDQPLLPPDRSQAFRLSLSGDIEAVFGSFGNQDGQFRLGHDIAVGRDGAVYVVDAWGMRVQKFVPQ